MDWDLGPQGLGVLAAMALGFRVGTQLVVNWRRPRWAWLIAAAAYFLGGLFISEAWFGWATEEDLQPNVDGLLFDEVLLIATFPGIAVLLLVRYLRRRRARSR